MSERHFRRLRDAYGAEGAEGLVDRRRGRVSGRRADVDEIAWVVEEFGARYFDCTAKLFHEGIHGRAMSDGRRFSRGYTWTKSVLQLRGLTTKAPKRSAHCKKRARRPLPGMLVFQDGSRHAWLPQGPELDLIVTWTTRRARCCRRPCVFTNTRMAGLRSSMVPGVLPIT